MEINFTLMMNGSQEATDSVSGWNVIAAVYFTLACVVAMVGNSVVILTVYKRRALHKVSYYLVTNLAAKDFSFALLVVALTPPGTVAGRWIFDHGTCIFYAVVTTWLSFVELLSLASLSLDRYFACVYPLRYHQLITPRRCFMAILFCWSYWFLWSTMPLVGFGQYVNPHNSFVCELDWSPKALMVAYVFSLGGLMIIPPSVIIVGSYVKIFLESRKVSRQTAPVLELRSGKSPRRPGNERRTNKATLTVGLITGIYFISWLPFLIVRIYQLLVSHVHQNTTADYIEMVTLYTFSIANFANPIIYGVYNKEFRKELKRLVRR